MDLPQAPPIVARTEHFEWQDGAIVSSEQLYLSIRSASFLIGLYSGMVIADWCDEDYENPIQDVLERMEVDFQEWLLNSQYVQYWLTLDEGLFLCAHGSAQFRCKACNTGGVQPD